MPWPQKIESWDEAVARYKRESPRHYRATKIGYLLLLHGLESGDLVALETPAGKLLCRGFIESVKQLRGR